MKQFTIGLIGNPNCGKTTLFNALTGEQQRVGNWPGVTVDRKSGYFELDENHIEVVDLPGIYSLSVIAEESAIDERIAADYMLANQADLIINVLDASNLERNLYLTTQLLELNIPVILVVNMLDVAKKHGITINLDTLAKALRCPAIGITFHKKQDINKLKELILNTVNKQQEKIILPYPAKIQQAIDLLTEQINNPQAYFLAVRLLEDDLLAKEKVSLATQTLTQKLKHDIHAALHEDIDILIADSRYGMIHNLVKKIVLESAHVKPTITTAIDKIVLNRFLGIPIFLVTIYIMFFLAINTGGLLQSLAQTASNIIFVQKLSILLINLHFPNWSVMILTTGLGKGISTTITFLPVLTTMFILLAILEGSGYMARAGFVVDRIMCALGLPGKSFVPMIIGFGCNVPAIMAARTLDNKRDRILTIIMTPFMSCSARLAIYAVFTAAFFPSGRQNIVFALYITGILVAIGTGLILRKTILVGQKSFLVAELPTYHLPSIRDVLLQTWCRLKEFITKAGQIIIPICIILSVLNNININHHKSVLAEVGHKITPILKPIGIEQNNWPATVGLIAGITTKEVVVATLNTLYAEGAEKQDIYGQMYHRFGGKAEAFAYLLFVLLYFPCIPALAVILRELGWRWAGFSMLWNTGIAYSTAATFYQVATFTAHPLYSTITILIITIFFISSILLMRLASKNQT